MGVGVGNVVDEGNRADMDGGLCIYLGPVYKILLNVAPILRERSRRVIC